MDIAGDTSSALPFTLYVNHFAWSTHGATWCDELHIPAFIAIADCAINIAIAFAEPHFRHSLTVMPPEPEFPCKFHCYLYTWAVSLIALKDFCLQHGYFLLLVGLWA
ncbi:MAG: hypothetical protein A3G49_03875 [Candidatus Sungbacteria bacterium RIFCSPLOWO2_12_FULL_41_11]|uniref:Uncharacterized protein n=1 Tax=Candidatus Sungbacteria bacterium RIFCSPLOWO2_12_FULL_41_11 TaxID=1802286 RepID=A0A1G2LMH1_9BACT|nr:MAG: hypothetical protein UV01_C0016G0013 [Parcubacteria group bacterium GW2011_GWA2_42_14]OHA00182.1 MAG: hypothetical protein A3D41_03685 [Candidatus Sungbacteria bacterium RIFCSPHIGHO2_02_FULL_41_12b]OHA12815.1 MAG: hypothetical protein A3G49_03875 [Candidatus Sungbacteria bacterium RIFCSPLOWO2_12_FULL_41_11]